MFFVQNKICDWYKNAKGSHDWLIEDILQTILPVVYGIWPLPSGENKQCNSADNSLSSTLLKGA